LFKLLFCSKESQSSFVAVSPRTRHNFRGYFHSNKLQHAACTNSRRRQTHQN
jgi:hypothetical protein